ncbi:MAG: thiol:disulfide interchange protein DsbA/DsbL [Proteobacteria bacterium]|nr:thiol:disulfide interchange protein DsbA/DsbL [Pseudomonadota bacterium]
MAKTRKDQISTIRTLIIVAVVVLVGGVLTWGVLYSTGVTEGSEIVEGTHYRTIENPPRRRPGDPIVVTEFFSYGCIHCKNFDPVISEWAANLPEGAEFRRSPVSFSPAWLVLAQAYLALEKSTALEQNHERIFRAVHDARRSFDTVDSIAEFVAGNGITREEFMTALNSSSTRRQLSMSETAQRRFSIASIPALVVGDTYVINMDIGRLEALEVASKLIAQMQAEGPSPTDQPAVDAT